MATKQFLTDADFEDAAPLKPVQTGVLGRAGDLGLSVLKGTMAVPEFLVGVANIPTGGKAGKAVEEAGVRFKDAKQILDDQMSVAGQLAQRKYERAEGFTGKVGAAIQNPSIISSGIAESAGPMGAGMAVGRGLMAVAPRVIGGLAGAIGEGVVGAGSAAEQIRQQTADGELTGKQAALAGATGLATTAFGALGNKIGNKLGVGDIDNALIGGAASQAPAKQAGLAKRVAGGAFSEGALEELPQSVSEQMLQNVALDRDPMQGVDSAAAMGLVTGGTMGAGFGILNRGQAPAAEQPPAQPPVAPTTTPGAPPAATPPTDPTLGQSLTGTPMADLMGGSGLTGGANPLQAGLSTLTSNNQMYPGMNTEPTGYTVDPETGAIIQADPVGVRQMAEPSAQVEAPAPVAQAPVAPAPAPPALGKSLTGTPVADMLDTRTPSQRMGLNPESGGLTAAAAIAVDSGASPVTAGMGLRALSGASPASQPVAEESTQQQAQPPAQQPILNNGKPFTLAEVGQANQAIGGTAVSVPGGWAIQPPQAAQKPAATPATAMPTDATPAASAQSAILGRNSQPIAEGGQPFFTREEAKAEKRMQPLMRVAPAEGGGFILKPASERQMAAVEKAAKRLKYPSTGETGPRSLHGFILQIGGLASGAMPDVGFDLNPRVGNRRLFSPRGKTIEQAAMAAKQEGYIHDEDENTLIEALKRSLNVSPVYTPDGYEAMAEAQMQARYEDFLAAEQDGGAENDWSRLTPEELAETGYNDYDEATQAEIRALVAQAEALGIDAESILEDVARRTENATQKDYENAAKSAIEAAIRSSEESRSRDLGQAGAEAGPATADTQAAPAAVTGPASDVRARNLAALKDRMMGQKKPTPTTPPAQTKASPAPEAGPTNQGATNGQGQETLLKAEQPTDAAAMVSGAPVADTSLNRDSSWVIRDKATGKVVMETFDRAKVDALNATKYEAVPIQQHLAEQGAKKPSDTTKPGGFTEKVRKAAGKVDAAPAQPILTSPTKADFEAKQARAEQAAKAKAAQDKADAARAAKERERKEVAAASVAAADTFELGQDAMANLTGQNDLQFSRAAAKEVRDLVTLHNLSEDNLMYAGKMGGIPVPSIGITKVETPFGGFGGITLIAPKYLIDPEAGVPVYDRDAWTARFPTLNFKKIKAKVADALFERMSAARDLGGDGSQFMSMLFDELRNARVQSPDKITSLFTRYSAPKILYAQEVLGKAIKPQMRGIKPETPFGHTKAWRDFVAKSDTRNMTEQREREFNREAAVAARAAMVELGEASKEGVDDRTARMLDSSLKSYLDRYITEDGMNAGILDRALRDVKSFGQKEIDPMKMDEAVRKVVPLDDAGYKKWVAGLVEPLFEAPTITVRGSEVPVTLENVVEAMTIGKTAGAEKSMTFGAGKAASMLGKKFKSIDEIKAARNQVVSAASEKEGKKSTEALISEYQNHVSAFYTGKDWKGNIDTWAALDSSLEALTKAGRNPTDGTMNIALQRSGFKRVDAKGISLARQALEALRDATTDYFEAKPQRAVRLNEFNGAVIPKGTSAEAIALLEENGITVEVHGNAEGAREKAIQKLAKKLDGKTGNVIFSRDTESPSTPAATIRAAITNAYGNLLDKLEGKGLVTIAQTEREAIEAAAQARADKTGGDAESIAVRMMSMAGLDVKYSANGNIEGFFDKQTGKSFLVADNLTAASAPGTLMHEVGIHMAAGGKMEALFKRAGSLLKTGTQNEFIQRVKARMARAGETSDEEAAAYIVTEYENDRAKAPITIGKWISDLTAAVRAWLFSKGIILKADQLTVADIAAVARANARSMARGGPNGGPGGGQAFSRTALPATLNIDGKDRPTTNSNGQHIHPTEEGVRNFWRWFSDSRVVDEQGRPLVVYHGTASDVDMFDAKKTGSATKAKSADGVFWFSDSAELAEDYAGFAKKKFGKNGARNIMPVYLQMSDPKIVDMGGKEYRELSFDFGGFVQTAKKGVRSGTDWVVSPKDGVILRNFSDTPSGRRLVATHYAVFLPAQIKSATGNTGAFSSADPDIRFSRAADMAGNAIDKARQTADKAMGKDFPRAASMPDLNDDQRSLLGKVGASQSPASDAIKAATDRAGLKIRQGMVDRFAALKELDEKALGQNFIADAITNSAWVLAKMSSAGSGALNAMMKTGRIEMDAQQKVIGLKGAPNGGLTASLQKLGGPAEVERFFAWMAANRSHAIIERNKEAIAKTAEAKRELKNIIEMQAIPGKTAQQVSQLSDARKEWEKVIAKHEPFLDVTERLFTEDEVAAGRTLNTGTTEDGKVRPALYSQVHAEFQQYRDDVLAIAEQTGIINSDNRAMWRDEFYVPFYRVMEDDADRGRSGGNGLSRQEAYKKLKGGKQNLNDLMENTLMNFHHLLSASLKNQAAVQAIKNAETVGIARKLKKINMGAEADLFMVDGTKTVVGDKKSITFILEKGKNVFYEVDDPLVFESITTLADPGLNNTAVRVMGAFKRLFTNMTTATPQFIIANTFRDLLQASATSPTSKNIAKNLKEGIQSYRDEKTRAEMLASGGAFSFGHIYGMGADEVKASLQKTVAGAGLISSPSMIPSMMRKMWDAWSNITDLSENASRAATYVQNVEQMGKLRAAFEARDVMDFSQHGAWPAVRLLVRIVPFLNARLQGLDKLYRSGLKPSILTAMGKGTDTDKQAAARFAMVTGALTLATMALYLINADDDEYKKLEEWQKDTYWFIRIGENAFFLPKPFEVGAIATMAERTLQQAMDDKATGKLFRERMWEMLMQTFAFNPTPQMFQPLIDVYSNKDAFTGRDIESAGMERMSAGLRSRDSTTAPATALSAVSRVFGDESSIAVSPVQADHLIKGYLGGVGAMAAGWIDTMYRAATGQSSPDKAWSEYQPIRRFYRDLDVPVANTRYTTLFYDGLKESNRVYADVMELQKLGRTEEAEALAAEKRNPLQIRIALNAQQRRLTEINNRMKEVRRSDKDGEWKRREIDLLNTQKAMITERMGKRIEDARVQ